MLPLPSFLSSSILSLSLPPPQLPPPVLVSETLPGLAKLIKPDAGPKL